MKLYLVRHGQSEGNIDKSKYFEKLDCDIELTEIGEVQISNAAHKILDLGDGHFQGNLFFSPYKRATQSADIIARIIEGYLGNSIYYYGCDPRLREREWGDLRDIVTTGRKTEGHFNFFYKPNMGESFANCYDRVACFHQWLIANHEQEDTIIVAHGEYLKLYAMYLMRWDLREFDKWRTPRNGEVMLFNEAGDLNIQTPLTEKIIKH